MAEPDPHDPVEVVAENGRHREQGQDDGQIHRPGGAEGADDEEHRVAGKKGGDHQAHLTEDDQGDESVYEMAVTDHQGRQVFVDMQCKINGQGNDIHKMRGSGGEKVKMAL